MERNEPNSDKETGHYIPICTIIGKSIPDDESLVDESGVITIAMSVNKTHKFNIVFEEYLVFRKVDEGDALKTVAALPRSRDGGTDVIFEVRESDFLAWFTAESLNIYEDRDPKHYLIVSENSLVDVISLGPPVCTDKAIT